MKLTVRNFCCNKFDVSANHLFADYLEFCAVECTQIHLYNSFWDTSKEEQLHKKVDFNILSTSQGYTRNLTLTYVHK